MSSCLWQLVQVFLAVVCFISPAVVCFISPILAWFPSCLGLILQLSSISYCLNLSRSFWWLLATGGDWALETWLAHTEMCFKWKYIPDFKDRVQKTNNPPKKNQRDQCNISMIMLIACWNEIIIDKVALCAKSLQSCATVFDPMDCSLPGSSVHNISQGRILKWGVTSSSRGSSQPRDQTHISGVSCIGRWFLYH